MAEDCEPTNRRGLLEALQECRVNMVSGHKVEGLTADGVKLVHRDTGEQRTLEAEMVVLALGAKPERGLVEDLKKMDIEFFPIGDCQQPRNIRQAIYEGALIGRQL